MWFIGVEVEQETGAPPPKKNPGSAPGIYGVPEPIKFLYSQMFEFSVYTVRSGACVTFKVTRRSFYKAPIKPICGHSSVNRGAIHSII